LAVEVVAVDQTVVEAAVGQTAVELVPTEFPE
jgi:hypothetical protein